MKIICERSLLLDYINIVLKAVSNRTTLPILECILLVADESGFRLVGNDLELGIETKQIKAEIIEQGSVALDSKIFSDIIRRMPGEQISISSDNKNITVIKSNKSEFKILGQNGGEFPFLPQVEKESEYTIPAKSLKEMIHQTIFSVAVNDSKAVMTGELLEIKDNQIKMVAVDGFRISLCVQNIKTENIDVKCVIPAKTLNELSKLFGGDDASTTQIYFTSKHILFETDNCIIVSRLLEGDFINYENVFTDEYTTLITIDRDLLLDGLERASLISKDAKKNPVKLNISGDTLVITSNTEAGTSYDELPIELDGIDIEIAFNPRYLIDALKVMDDEKLTMQFTTPLSPCIVKGLENETYKYLVLPLRLKG